MRTLTKILAATVVTVALSATGFAGAASAKELTTKQFLQKANAICKATEKKVAAISNESFAGYADETERPPDDVVESFVGQLVRNARGMLTELEALDGPPALEKKLAKVLASYATAMTAAKAYPQGFFDEPGEVLYQPEQMARKIGIECGNSDSSAG